MIISLYLPGETIISPNGAVGILTALLLSGKFDFIQEIASCIVQNVLHGDSSVFSTSETPDDVSVLYVDKLSFSACCCCCCFRT